MPSIAICFITHYTYTSPFQSSCNQTRGRDQQAAFHYFLNEFSYYSHIYLSPIPVHPCKDDSILSHIPLSKAKVESRIQSKICSFLSPPIRILTEKDIGSTKPRTLFETRGMRLSVHVTLTFLVKGSNDDCNIYVKITFIYADKSSMSRSLRRKYDHCRLKASISFNIARCLTTGRCA